MSVINATFKVRTAGAGIIREGELFAPTKARACAKAIEAHRHRLLDLAADASSNRQRRIELARTASILVSVVEVIDFEVGTTLPTTGGDAA